MTGLALGEGSLSVRIAIVFACICMPRVVAPCGFVQEDRVRPSEALPARWSDPCAMDGSHGSLRGGSARQFGPDMTQEFLEKMLGEGNAGQCGRWVDSVSPCSSCKGLWIECSADQGTA